MVSHRVIASAVGSVALSTFLFTKYRIDRALAPTAENDVDVWMSDDEQSAQDLVVILCWGGAKRSNIRALSNLYREHAATIITLNSTTSTYLSGIPLVEYLDDLLLIAEHYETCKGRMIFHIFSNHGLLALASMVLAGHRFREKVPEHLQTFVNEFPSNIDAVIVDSAPYFPLRLRMVPETVYSIFEAVGYYHVMGPVVRRSPANTQYAERAVLALPTLVVSLFWRNIKCAVNRSFLTPNAILDAVSQDPLRFLPREGRICFMHSVADRLIPATAVESFVERLRNLGAHHIENVVFADAPHVALLKIHTAQYLKVVEKFLF